MVHHFLVCHYISHMCTSTCICNHGNAGLKANGFCGTNAFSFSEMSRLFNSDLLFAVCQQQTIIIILETQQTLHLLIMLDILNLKSSMNYFKFLSTGFSPSLYFPDSEKYIGQQFRVLQLLLKPISNLDI